MKFLKIKNNEYKVLKLGEDFDGLIFDHNTVFLDKRKQSEIDSYLFHYLPLDDFYQSRPLIEIGGYCEFDVVSDACGNSDLDDEDDFMLLTFGFGTFHTSRYSPCNNSTLSVLKSLGSIFLPENQLKYPELYQEALSLLLYNRVYGSYRN